MTHELVRKITGDYNPTEYDGRLFTDPRSYRSDFGGVTLHEVLEAVGEITHRLESESGVLPVVVHAELVHDRQSLLYFARMMSDRTPAWCVVSTYNQNGGFRPGKQVEWSGHLTREEAERCMSLWMAHLDRPLDPFHVDFRPIAVHMMRRTGWDGPRR